MQLWFHTFVLLLFAASVSLFACFGGPGVRMAVLAEHPVLGFSFLKQLLIQTYTNYHQNSRCNSSTIWVKANLDKCSLNNSKSCVGGRLRSLLFCNDSDLQVQSMSIYIQDENYLKIRNHPHWAFRSQFGYFGWGWINTAIRVRGDDPRFTRSWISCTNRTWQPQENDQQRNTTEGLSWIQGSPVHTPDALPSLARQMESPECSNPWQNEKHLDVAVARHFQW